MSGLNVNATAWEPPGFRSSSPVEPNKKEEVAAPDAGDDETQDWEVASPAGKENGASESKEALPPLKVEEVEEEEEEEEELPEPESEPVKTKVKSKKKKRQEELESKSDSLIHDQREHLNIVFIGHVDAGKSTISGQILYSTNQVDDRTIEKFKRLARDQNRESWWMAYLLDTDEEERAKGKTVEVGRAHFETKKKRYTILDAPGHKNYVPAMIQGAAQADIGILVISARRNEFEAGFDRAGQTREHAMLAKTLGISKLVVVINKMDDSSVKWSQARFDFCVTKLMPFLKASCGFRDKDIVVVPLSGLTGVNLKDPMPAGVCDWYKGKSLFQTLDSLKTVKRDPSAPLRVPLVDKYKDMGVIIAMGKVESGTLFKNQTLEIVPRGMKVECVGISVDDEEVDCARCGENVDIKLKNCELDDIHPGDVLSAVDDVCSAVKAFECQMAVLDLLEHKPLLSSGYQCVLHCHALSVDCEIVTLVSSMTRKKTVKKPRFVRSNTTVTCRIKVLQTAALEKYKQFPQLGRFTLRDEGKTIAIGKIMKISLA